MCLCAGAAAFGIAWLTTALDHPGGQAGPLQTMSFHGLAALCRAFGARVAANNAENAIAMIAKKRFAEVMVARPNHKQGKATRSDGQSKEP